MHRIALCLLIAAVSTAPTLWAQDPPEAAHSVAVEGEWAFVGEPVPTLLPRNAVVVFRMVDGSWMKADTLMGETEGERFGHALEIAGGRLFIGAPTSGGTGAVYVYELDESGSTWLQAHHLQTTSHQLGAEFGHSLDASGDTLIVGAPLEEDGQGAAYIFVRDEGGAWFQLDKLDSGVSEAAYFGYSVAVIDSAVAVGAPLANDRRGLAVTFTPDESGVWSAQQVLESGDEAGRLFGWSVGAEHGKMIVGSPETGDIGAAYVFTLGGDTTTWAQVDVLRQASASEALYGWDVDLYDGRALIGAPGSASVYLVGFDASTGTYAAEHTFTNPAVSGSAWYGYDVDLYYRQAIIGATGVEGAFVYDKSKSVWHQTTLMFGDNVGRLNCVDGMAGTFPCRNVNLLSYMPIPSLGTDATKRLNDLWGWTDPQTGVEYALVGRTDGTAFVDLSNPEEPVLVGSLPTHTTANVWRDVKVINDHAVVVADNVGSHGMQIFDLRRLRNVTSPPVTFSADAVYDKFGSSHNVVVNDESDYVYAVGISGQQSVPAGAACGPGYHIVDMSDPKQPTFAGCHNPAVGRGYVHDAQCLPYAGPDAAYVGRDICFGAAEDGLAITDVTDPAQGRDVGLVDYPNAGPGYTHQGWLTADQRYFIVNDELDELNGLTPRTRTLVFDVEDLDDPVFVGEYLGETSAIDHNLYVVDGKAFEANYSAGLRIIDLGASDDLDPGAFTEVGYFDVYPRHNLTMFVGAWSTYPFFDSGIVLISGIESGLFVVEPMGLADVAAEPEAPRRNAFSLAVYPNPAAGPATLRLEAPAAMDVRVELFDVLGRRIRVLHDGFLEAGSQRFAVEPAGLPAGTYFVRAIGDGVTATTALTLHP